MKYRGVFYVFYLVFLISIDSQSNTYYEIANIFSACKKTSPNFDSCMKKAFNKIRPYFKDGLTIELGTHLDLTSFVAGVNNQGIPEIGVAPFDPHFAPQVLQTRGVPGLNYTLTLHNVYERGWTTSTVTKFKTDWQREEIVYSQYFPEKWLEGDYVFHGNALGSDINRTGRWNLTLRDYAQTTRIRRQGSGVDVHVEIDRIGGMEIHVGNLLRGRSVLEGMLDLIINATWKPGFAVIRPLINDLVSTAFTDIWSKSFKDFPIDKFIRD